MGVLYTPPTTLTLTHLADAGLRRCALRRCIQSWSGRPLVQVCAQAVFCGKWGLAWGRSMNCSKAKATSGPLSSVRQ